MDGEGGFEFVEDRVCIYTYLHSWGWGFWSRDILESLHGLGLCVWISNVATL